MTCSAYLPAEHCLDDQLLTVGDVIACLRISRGNLYKLMAQGRFPRPMKLGSRTARWRARDVHAWIESFQ